MTDLGATPNADSTPTAAESPLLRRLPELDSCEPETALAIYAEISAALVEAFDGADGSVHPS